VSFPVHRHLAKVERLAKYSPLLSWVDIGDSAKYMFLFFRNEREEYFMRGSTSKTREDSPVNAMEYVTADFPSKKTGGL